MALLPIIYTSLIVVMGLFLLVFSFSYISYRLRKTPIKANYANPVLNPTKKNIKIKLKEGNAIPNHPVLQNEKQINVIREENNNLPNDKRIKEVSKITLKKKKRFSIIQADDIRKFNHIPENIAINSISRITAISMNELNNGDILRFYDEQP